MPEVFGAVLLGFETTSNAGLEPLSDTSQVKLLPPLPPVSKSIGAFCAKLNAATHTIETKNVNVFFIVIKLLTDVEINKKNLK